MAIVKIGKSVHNMFTKYVEANAKKVCFHCHGFSFLVQSGKPVLLLTLKASSLNNRSVRRTCGKRCKGNSTLTECPTGEKGDPFRVGVVPLGCPVVLCTARLLSGDACSVSKEFITRNGGKHRPLFRFSIYPL